MNFGVKTFDDGNFLKSFENDVSFFEVSAILGNDYSFLNGIYGTAYTVGFYDTSLDSPRPVMDFEKRLLHSGGTRFLLEGLL